MAGAKAYAVKLAISPTITENKAPQLNSYNVHWLSRDLQKHKFHSHVHTYTISPKHLK